MSNIEGYINAGMYILVQGLVKEKPLQVPDSVLHTTCKLSNDFYLVPTTSFVSPAFVVDNVECPNESLFMVPPMSMWADEFLELFNFSKTCILLTLVINIIVIVISMISFLITPTSICCADIYL